MSGSNSGQGNVSSINCVSDSVVEPMFWTLGEFTHGFQSQDGFITCVLLSLARNNAE